MRGLSSFYYFAYLTVLIGISLASPTTQPTSTTGPNGNCTKVNSCSCSYPDGTVIDLSPLSKSDGTAYFSNVTAKNGNVFSWNPCNPFSFPAGQTRSNCGNVALCQIPASAPKGTLYNLGKQATATFTKDKGGVHLSYASSSQGGRFYTANIILKCNKTLQQSVLDVDSIQPFVSNATKTVVFSFILNSKFACSFSPNASTTSPPAQTTSTSASNTSETTSSSKTTAGTSEMPQSSSKRGSTTTPAHSTTTQSGATSLQTLHCFVMLCFVLFKYVWIFN